MARDVPCQRPTSMPRLARTHGRPHGSADKAASVITSSTAPIVSPNLKCSSTHALDLGPRSESVPPPGDISDGLRQAHGVARGYQLLGKTPHGRAKSSDVRGHSWGFAGHRLANNQALCLRKYARENGDIGRSHKGRNVRPRPEERDPVTLRQALQLPQVRRRSAGAAQNQIPHLCIEAADCVDQEMRSLDPFQSSGKYRPWTPLPSHPRWLALPCVLRVQGGRNDRCRYLWE